MASRLDGLLDAVTASLAAATLTTQATPTVAYVPRSELRNLSSPTLLVSPASRSSEMTTRTQDDDTWVVYVAFAQKIAVGTRSAVQAMNEQAEEIWTHLRRRDMDVDGTRYAWREIATVPGADAGYSFEDIEQHRAFLSVFRVTYLAIE